MKFLIKSLGIKTARLDSIDARGTSRGMPQCFNAYFNRAFVNTAPAVLAFSIFATGFKCIAHKVVATALLFGKPVRNGENIMLRTVISAGCLLVLLFSPVAFAADAKKNSGNAMPTIQEFQAFFKQYQDACRNKDAAFLRKMLPPDIPKDHFAFVLNASRQVVLDLDASGVKPKFVQTKNRYDAHYEGKLGDGMTKMTLDFYFHEGRWLKYDPTASK